jgi:hypothetical protein
MILVVLQGGFFVEGGGWRVDFLVGYQKRVFLIVN